MSASFQELPSVLRYAIEELLHDKRLFNWSVISGDIVTSVVLRFKPLSEQSSASSPSTETDHRLHTSLNSDFSEFNMADCGSDTYSMTGTEKDFVKLIIDWSKSRVYLRGLTKDGKITEYCLSRKRGEEDSKSSLRVLEKGTYGEPEYVELHDFIVRSPCSISSDYMMWKKNVDEMFCLWKQYLVQRGQLS